MPVRSAGGGAVAWCGRLLLFTALLVGIVTMHTLGHPSETRERPRDAAPAAAPHAIAPDGTTAHGALTGTRPARVPAAPAPPAGRPAPPDPVAPAAGPGPETRAATALAGPHPPTPAVRPAAGHHASHGTAAEKSAGPARAHPATRTADAPDPDGPPRHGPGHGGTDPLSVCLAVLAATAALLAAVLLGAALRRAHGARTASAHARFRALSALWPLPPPPVPRSSYLVQLSVLRL